MIIENGLLRIRFKTVNIRSPTDAHQCYIPSIYFFTLGRWQYCGDLMSYLGAGLYGQAIHLEIITNTKAQIIFQITWVYPEASTGNPKFVYEYEIKKGIPIIWIDMPSAWKHASNSTLVGFHTCGLQPYGGKGRFTYTLRERSDSESDALYDDRISSDASDYSDFYTHTANFVCTFDPSYDWILTMLSLKKSVEGVYVYDTNYPRISYYNNSVTANLGLLLQENRDYLGRDICGAIALTSFPRMKLFVEAESSDTTRITVNSAPTYDDGDPGAPAGNSDSELHAGRLLDSSGDWVKWTIGKLPKGGYLVYARVYGETASVLYSYSVSTSGATLNSVASSVGNAWTYIYLPFVINDDDLGLDVVVQLSNLDVENDNLYLDYFVLVPLSNGFDGPQDLASAARIR